MQRFTNTLVSDTSGDDYIDGDYAENVLFVYSGGNDTIRGFDSTCTLKIASGTHYGQRKFYPQSWQQQNHAGK